MFIPTKQKNYRGVAVHLMLLSLGAVIIILMVWFSGVTIEMIRESIVSTKYYYLFVVLGATFLATFITSLKWEAILNDLVEIKETTKGYFLYYSAIGLIANYIVPQIGNYGLKTASMKLSYNVPVDKGLLSILIEQLFDLLTLVLVMLPSVLFYLKILSLNRTLIFIGILFTGAFALLVYNHVKVVSMVLRTYEFLYGLVVKLLPTHNDQSVKRTMLHNEVSLSRNTSLKVLYYSILKYLCLTTRFYVVVLSLRIDVSFVQILLASAIVQGITLITFIPGSLGILEASWFGILTLLGVNRSEIGAFVIISRVLCEVSLIITVLISYFYYLSNKIVLNKIVRHTIGGILRG